MKDSIFICVFNPYIKITVIDYITIISFALSWVHIPTFLPEEWLLYSFYQSKELAKRVDDLLHTGNNYMLIGDSYKESIY